METSKIPVPEDVLEKIKAYCLEAGQPVENWVATTWRFLEKNDIDIIMKRVNRHLPALRMWKRNAHS